MSGGAVFQEVLRIVQHLQPDDVAGRDLLAALEAPRPGPLPLLYDAGFEAGLSRSVLLRRSAALYFSFCAGNLADDLVDDECGWLEDPVRTGPPVQFMLQNLFIHAAASEQAALDSTTLHDTAAELVRAAFPQQTESRAEMWTAGLYRTVGEGIVGRQWAAYLRLLWAGTPLSDSAPEVGLRLGIAAHVAEDIRSFSPRFVGLRPEHQHEVVAWAEEQSAHLSPLGLRCLASPLEVVKLQLAAWKQGVELVR